MVQSGNGEEGRGEGPGRRPFLALCAGIVLVAAALRVGGMLNDLWLDEIWSVDNAGSLSSISQVFTGIHYDNNHYLNTCWIYLCGQRGNWWGYRAPAVLAGIGTVVVAGLLGRRRSRCGAVMAMAVATTSYVLVLYSSEARGYAALVFCALLSRYALDAYLRDGRRWQAALFAACAVVGLCSHLAFVSFLCAAAVWCAWQLRRQRASAARVGRTVIGCFLTPVLTAAWLYQVDVRYLRIGGGTPAGLFASCQSALAWSVAAPFGTRLVPVVAAAALLGFVAAGWLLWREQPDQDVVFTVILVAVSVGQVAILGAGRLYVRYFVVCIAFMLLVDGAALARLYERGPRARAVSLALLALFVLANGRQTTVLMRFGRGHYEDAVRFIVTQSDRGRAVIGGDHDFRVERVLWFYRQELGATGLAYVAHETWPQQGVDWLLCHRESHYPPEPPAPAIEDWVGNRYDLAAVYPAAPLSGLHWFIFRRTGTAGRSGPQGQPAP